MERIPTLIPGLDDLLAGGPPAGSLILVRGESGTGKSLLVLQSLFYGALNGETSIYFPFDETPENIQWYAEVFGWDIGRVQREKRFYIYYLSKQEYDRFKPELLDSLRERITYIISSTGAKRIAFDSLTTISIYLNDLFAVREMLKTLSTVAKKTKSIIYVTLHPDDPARMIYEMVSDGIIELFFYEDVGGVRSRGIRIAKMRATRHPIDHYALWIEDTGISVEKL